MTVAVDAITIDLEHGCEFDTCETYANEMYELLNVPRYSRGASLMPVPESRDAWEAEHRTARKRAWRAERFGYRVETVDFSRYSDDIYEINTSLEERQGRPMADGYRARGTRNRLKDEQTRCPRHRTTTYGVLQHERLRAYLTLHRRGDLAMVSMILGHGEHLDAGIMFLLFRGVVEDQADQGGWFYYNSHSSGQDGLRWMKERLGFRAEDIEWRL